jgi:hypothetical protein
MVVHRFAIVLLAVLIGAAAPARAWCEASCLAPPQVDTSTKAHCPTHDVAPPGTSMSATTIDDCPVIESARPIPARLDVQVFSRVALPYLTPSAPKHLSIPAPQHPTAIVSKRLTPLRI